ncbi:MAG: ABC transporter permease [Acidobacteria bacterium]|nr:ABC transporter permease [Acidobacteriota bacterium]
MTAIEGLPVTVAAGIDPTMPPGPGGRSTASGVATTRRRGRASRVMAILAIMWLGLVLVLAIGADLLPLAPYDAPVGGPRETPGLRLHEPLGTDAIGRSQLSRAIYGARVSLSVGILSVLLGLAAGGTLGMIAGYFGGKLDAVIGTLNDSVLAFPPLVLLLAITAIFRQSLPTLIGSLAVLSTPSFVRLARAGALSYKEREFVIAARSMGASHARILTRELLPNLMFSLLSYSFLIVAVIIVAEGSLSFLGLGIPPPTPSWGGMVATGRDYLATDPQLVFTPAVIFLLTVLSFNVLGDRARRRFDTRASALS